MEKKKLLEQVHKTLRLRHYSIHAKRSKTMICKHIVQQGGLAMAGPLDDLP